jgi:hypothetical protein
VPPKEVSDNYPALSFFSLNCGISTVYQPLGIKMEPEIEQEMCYYYDSAGLRTLEEAMCCADAYEAFVCDCRREKDFKDEEKLRKKFGIRKLRC